jgi:hypothetical protein
MSLFKPVSKYLSGVRSGPINNGLKDAEHLWLQALPPRPVRTWLHEAAMNLYKKDTGEQGPALIGQVTMINKAFSRMQNSWRPS